MDNLVQHYSRTKLIQVRSIFFLTLIVFCYHCCAAQQKTPEEMQAYLREVQRRADSLMNDPALKKYFDTTKRKLPKGNDVVVNPPASGGGGGRRVEPVKPFRGNSSLLKKLPSKIIKPSDLQAYLVELEKRLQKSLPGPTASVKQLIFTFANDPKKLEQAAAYAYAKGSPGEAVLLMCHAAVTDPRNGLLLSNTGAMLDLVGLPELGVPILRTVTHYQPGNYFAQNNLGQVFAQLNLLDSALVYFQNCIASSSKHPEANHTAGYIYLLKSNTARAKAMYENSIKGAFSVTAYNHLIQIAPDSKVAPWIRPNIQFPDYWNQLKYILPMQCTNVTLTASSREEHIEYRKMLRDLISEMAARRRVLENDMSTKGIDTLFKRIGDHGSNFGRPFFQQGYIMSIEVGQEYIRDLLRLDSANKMNRRHYDDVMQLYKNKYEVIRKKYWGSISSNCCGEGNTTCCPDLDLACEEMNRLRNDYLKKLAIVNEEWQQQTRQFFRKYLNELLFWNYLGSTSENHFLIHFYSLVGNYLEYLYKVCETTILEECIPPPKPKVNLTPIEEPFDWKCLFSAKIPFLVGKFELNCDKFLFKAGEGVILKFEKSFKGKRNVTLAIGIGGALDGILGTDEINAGFQIKAENMLYFVFDQAGNLVDMGVNNEIKSEAALQFGDGLRLKMPMMKENIATKLSLNNGMTMEDGPLRKLIFEVLEIPMPEPHIRNN